MRFPPGGQSVAIFCLRDMSDGRDVHNLLNSDNTDLQFSIFLRFPENVKTCRREKSTRLLVTSSPRVLSVFPGCLVRIRDEVKE